MAGEKQGNRRESVVCGPWSGIRVAVKYRLCVLSTEGDDEWSIYIRGDYRVGIALFSSASGHDMVRRFETPREQKNEG